MVQTNEKPVRHKITFARSAWISFTAVLMLITVGGLVRATGAGLGCPDWPTCWGCWFPPTSIEAIPSVSDEEGNKFFKDKKGKLHPIEDFDLGEMWIEYLNRMLGVIIGLLIMGTFWFSIRLRKTDPLLFSGSLAALILVIVEGWLGAMVVQSGLRPGLITIHMLLAMILLCLLLGIARMASKPSGRVATPSKLGKFMTFAVLLQIAVGTQVREKVDPFIKDSQGLPREEWLERTGIAIDLHRTMSWLVVVATVATWLSIRNDGKSREKLGLLGITLVLVQVLIGLWLENFDLPPVSQVLHLTFGSMLICISFCIGWPRTLSEKEVNQTTPTH